MSRLGCIAVLSLAVLAGCGDDGAVTPKGGQAFDAAFTAVASVRYPRIIARAFGRTVNNAAVVDSIVGEVALMKQLDGRARYQFYIVNGLDSTATPVSHRQWIIRTDTLLDANGGLNSPVDTNRTAGVRDFWRGGFFGQKLRFAVTLSATDSVQQRGAWLVMTIQADSTRTAFNDSTPRPLFVRFRDQKGTQTRDDDAVQPGHAPRQLRRLPEPGAADDVRRRRHRHTVVLGCRLDRQAGDSRGLRRTPQTTAGLLLPAVHHRQPVRHRIRLGTGLRRQGRRSSATRTLARTAFSPVLRAVQPSNDVIGQAENYTRVDLILEPKTAAPLLRTGLAIYSAMTVQQASIPAALRSKRAALGTVQAIVTRGTQGGAPAPNVGVVLQGPGLNFNTLIGNKNTDSTGTARFTGVPVGEVRVHCDSVRRRARRDACDDRLGSDGNGATGRSVV